MTAFWCGLAITSVVLFIVLAGEVSLDRSWHAALVAMALVVVGLFALLCFGLTAALGVLGLRLLTEAAVRGVVVVETRTADGTIGMVGAGMLVMGFSMQIIGAA